MERYRRWVNGDLKEEIETYHLFDGEQRVLMVEDVLLTDNQNLDEGVLYRYQYGNHLGSVGLELDFEGKIISYEEYHPFGTTAFSARNEDIKAVRKRYRYTGMERDEESGLSYHSARYYLPWLGRWGSVDPEGLVDGGNLYGYVNGNPVNYSDPNGRERVQERVTQSLEATSINVAAMRSAVYGDNPPTAFEEQLLAGELYHPTMTGGNGDPLPVLSSMVQLIEFRTRSNPEGKEPYLRPGRKTDIQYTLDFGAEERFYFDRWGSVTGRYDIPGLETPLISPTDVISLGKVAVSGLKSVAKRLTRKWGAGMSSRAEKLPKLKDAYAELSYKGSHVGTGTNSALSKRGYHPVLKPRVKEVKALPNGNTKAISRFTGNEPYKVHAERNALNDLLWQLDDEGLLVGKSLDDVLGDSTLTVLNVGKKGNLTNKIKPCCRGCCLIVDGVKLSPRQKKARAERGKGIWSGEIKFF